MSQVVQILKTHKAGIQHTRASLVSFFFQLLASLHLPYTPSSLFLSSDLLYQYSFIFIFVIKYVWRDKRALIRDLLKDSCVAKRLSTVKMYITYINCVMMKYKLFFKLSYKKSVFFLHKEMQKEKKTLKRKENTKMMDSTQKKPKK